MSNAQRVGWWEYQPGKWKPEPWYSMTSTNSAGDEITELFDHTTWADALRAKQTRLNVRQVEPPEVTALRK